MSRRQADPLRRLRDEERNELERLSRSRSAPAAHVARARALLAVAAGESYTAAAHLVGRQHGDTVRAWVSRFHRDGVSAVIPQHGGGPPIQYAEDAQQRILTLAQRVPDRAQDGTATWSLSTLQTALRRADKSLAAVSTYTIWNTLHQAGLSWQQSRTWCETGIAVRARKHGVVEIEDIDATPKKS
jgi:transposase